jgi:hypothetical protein
MPVSSFVDPHSRFVITLCVGEVTLAEGVSSCSVIRNHPGFHPDFRQLVDLSMATNISLRFPDLYHLHQECDPFSNQARRAIVAIDAVPFGLGRMYQLITNSPNLEVFRTLQEALDWLDCKGSVLESVIRELLAKKRAVLTAESSNSSSASSPSTDLGAFLNRLKAASSA